MDYKRLGERIREERLRLNLTQAQLAEALGEWERYKGRLDAIFYSGASSNGGKV